MATPWTAGATVGAARGTGAWRVVASAGVGTALEWYDFYLYGALAPVLARQFVAALDAGSAFVFALLAFAAGFVVRPLGALFFGRLGDLIGRKYTLLVTIVIMGLSTFIVGILPSYASIGVAAPVILVGLRLLQGLAIGGEYGGAAILVAEHAPAHRRGAYTSWIQATATLGLLLALAATLAVGAALGEAESEAWGWRVPFVASIAVVGIGAWIRLGLPESPRFRALQDAGRTSKAPLTESFARPANLKRVALALFGLTAGQAVVWYTGQFYALWFLTETLKVDAALARGLVAASLLIGLPFFVVFGTLADRIGRKPLVMAGCLLAALTTMPLFAALTEAANPALARALAGAPVTVEVDPARCSFPVNWTGQRRFFSSCDIATQALAGLAVDYAIVAAPGTAVVRIGRDRIAAFDATPSADGLALDADSRRREAEFRRALRASIAAHGYPARADPAQVDRPAVVALLAMLVVIVAMVYGPTAAMLVEMFPTRIRYTSVSLPYHLGNGWFGGLLPTVAVAVVAYRGDIYSGLWFPVGVAASSFVVGSLWLRETRGVDLGADD